MGLKEIIKILKKHKMDLNQLGVIRLALFGSTIRHERTKKSDIDILIDFDSKRGIFAFVELRNYLETLLKCSVDLETRNALHPALKKKILDEAQVVF